MHSSRNESERNESERNGSQRSGSDVLVVGGGIIGLVTAWRAAQRGLRTALADPDPGGGAARVAAGMLAAVTELHYGEETLLGLNVASAARYPRFAAELAEASGGMDIGYRACGTLAVALDADDRLHLRELHALQRRCGLESQWLTGRECRRLEPMLAPGVRGGLRVDGDHQVDPRLAAALLAACERAGVAVHRARADRLLTTADRAVGAVLEDGTELRADQVVLAVSSLSGRLAGCRRRWPYPYGPSRGRCCGCRCRPRTRRSCPGPYGPSCAAATSTWCPARTASSSSEPPARNSAGTPR